MSFNSLSYYRQYPSTLSVFFLFDEYGEYFFLRISLFHLISKERHLYSCSQEEPVTLLGVASTPVLGVLSAGSDVLLVGSFLLPVSSLQLSSQRWLFAFGGTRNSSPYFSIVYKKTFSSQGPSSETDRSPVVPLSVFGWFGTRVTCEMVSDGGGRFIPAGIVGFHTLSVLLASLVAHDRPRKITIHTTQESNDNRTQVPYTVHGYSTQA